MNELQPTLIEKLKKELTEKLISEYPGRSNNGINIKRAADEIDVLAKNAYSELKSRHKTLSNDDKSAIQFMKHLERIDAELSKVDPESSLSHSTLRTFITFGGNLQPRVLHIFSLYLGYNGWFDFVDKQNENSKTIEIPRGDLPRDTIKNEVDKQRSAPEQDISSVSTGDIVHQRKKSSLKWIWGIILIFCILGCYWYTHPYIFDKFEEGENGILILRYTENKDEISVENEIRAALSVSLEKFDFAVKKSHLSCKTLNIISFDKPSEERAYARKLAKDYNAKIVLWGSINAKVRTKIEFIATLPERAKVKSNIRINEFETEKGEVSKELINNTSILAKHIVALERFYSGNTEGAIKLLYDLQKAYPNSSSSYVGVLEMLHFSEMSTAIKNENWEENEFLEKAERRLREILKIEPNNGFASYHLATINIFKSDFEKAISNYKKALKYDNIDSVGIFKHLGFLYSNNVDAVFNSQIYDVQVANSFGLKIENNFCFNVDSAIFYLEKIPKPEQDLSVKYLLAQYYFEKQKFDLSLAFFQTCYSVDSLNNGLLHNIALCNFHLGKLTTAKDLFLKVISNEDDNYKAMNLLAQVYFNKGEFNKSVEYFERSYAISGDSSTIKKFKAEIDNRRLMLLEDLYQEHGEEKLRKLRKIPFETIDEKGNVKIIGYQFTEQEIQEFLFSKKD